MARLDTAPQASDWHPADIVAALKKRGWSLGRLSLAHGYHRSTLQRALMGSYPNAERIIAAAIGVPPQKIWPQRFIKRGSPVRHDDNSTPVPERRNTQPKGAA